MHLFDDLSRADALELMATTSLKVPSAVVLCEAFRKRSARSRVSPMPFEKGGAIDGCTHAKPIEKVVQ